MNLGKESGMHTLIFARDTVRYRDKILPAGTVACTAMNIPRESLTAALPLCRRIAPVNTMLRTGNADKAVMSSACSAAHFLLKLIAQNEPFMNSIIVKFIMDPQELNEENLRGIRGANE